MEPSRRLLLAHFEQALTADAPALAFLSSPRGPWQLNRAFRALCRQRARRDRAALQALLERGGRQVWRAGQPLLLWAPARGLERARAPMRWRLRFFCLRRRGRVAGVGCRLDLQAGWRGSPGLEAVLPWYLPAPPVQAPDGAAVGRALAHRLRGQLGCVHPKDREALLGALGRSLLERRRFAFDCRLKQPCGPYHWHRIAGRPDCGQDGEVRGWLGGSQDRQTRNQVSDVRRRFVRLASHELNTPLTSLTLNLQLALRRAAHPPRNAAGAHEPAASAVVPVLHRALEQTRKLSHTVHQMLDAQAGATAPVALKKEPADLGALVDAAVAEATPALTAAGCTVATRIEGNLLHELDVARMQQVLEQLLGNAAKFAPNSHVTVEARREAGGVAVAVRDDGPGIDRQSVRDIFRPFVRGHVHRSTSGLGLGLTLARQIVRAHGGRLSLEPSHVRGAHFLIGLPSACTSSDECS